jgi:hypothetical protein
MLFSSPSSVHSSLASLLVVPKMVMACMACLAKQANQPSHDMMSASTSKSVIGHFCLGSLDPCEDDGVPNIFVLVPVPGTVVYMYLVPVLYMDYNTTRVIFNK